MMLSAPPIEIDGKRRRPSMRHIGEHVAPLTQIQNVRIRQLDVAQLARPRERPSA